VPISDFNVQAWLTRQLEWERDLERLHRRARAERRPAPVVPPPMEEAPPQAAARRRRLATRKSPERGISSWRRRVTIRQ
jgi:hypothetical protein